MNEETVSAMSPATRGRDASVAHQLVDVGRASKARHANTGLTQ
jgi:hypothetical protein